MRANEVIGGNASKPKSGYIAFELSSDSRSKLAQTFPPKFSDFIGHHITYQFGVKSNQPMPEAKTFRVVGYACNEAGLECLVVEVDGTVIRPDGETYHCTWSLDRDAGFKPVMSKALCANGWEKISHPINITATAKFF